MAQQQTRLIQSNAQTSSSQGKATFTIGPAEQGLVYQGTVQIPNAPAGALFIATVLNANWGQFAGPTNFGPIQLWGGESLTIQATGLNPNTNYVLTYFGTAIDENDAIPLPPTAPESVVTVETTTLLLNGVAIPNTGTTSYTITPPSLTRRLTLAWSIGQFGNAFDLSVLKVTGNQTGIVYFLELATTGNSIPEVQYAAIEPNIDQTYTISGSNTGFDGAKLWVVASSTNPLIVGEQNSPIPILQPIEVVGVSRLGLTVPVVNYPPIDQVSSIVISDNATHQLIPAGGGQPGATSAFLGTLSVYLPAAMSQLQLSDSGGNIIWQSAISSGMTQSFPILFRTTSLVNAQIVAGRLPVRVTLTWGAAST